MVSFVAIHTRIMAYQWLHEFCQKYGFSSTVEHLLTEMNLTELRNLIVFKQNLLCLKDELAYAIESETRANDCSSLAAIQPTFNDIDLITQACADDLYLTTPPPPLSQLPSINTVLNPSITSAMSSPFSMNYLEAFDTLDFAEGKNC